jgi:hypothetical protein
LLITLDKQFLITNNIEAVRLEKEEGLASQGWDFRVVPWFETNAFLQEEMSALKVGTDGLLPGSQDLSSEIAHIRANLTPEEGERFRTLGRLCSQAMDAAARFVHPGKTEYEIAALLGKRNSAVFRPLSILLPRTSASSTSDIPSRPPKNSNATPCWYYAVVVRVWYAPSPA